MNNKIVYHICCLNDWKEIFSEQLSRLQKSNIFDQTSSFDISVLYKTQEDLDFIAKKIKNIDIANIKFSSTDLKLYEYPALNILYSIAEQEDCNILYFHGKGVSCDKSHTHHSSSLKDATNDWRHFLEYFVIDNFDKCLTQLSNGYDACGAELKTIPFLHFKGNFWWASSSYLKKLDKPPEKTPNRFFAEKWLGKSNGNFFNFYSCKEVGYFSRISEDYKIFKK